MEMLPVDSSALHSVGYDPQTRTLKLRFANGGTYEYDDVPPQRYEALMSSASKGRHFREHILNRHPARRVS
jgi:hypothetical protein